MVTGPELTGFKGAEVTGLAGFGGRGGGGVRAGNQNSENFENFGKGRPDFAVKFSD
jgi:hypothetical protein